MSRVERLHREKVTRYSIRKYSFGAASVAVAALFMFLGNGAVSANELSKQDTPDVEALAPALDAPSTPAESTPAAQPVVEEPAKPAAPEVTTPALDKKQLENYISEVKSKLSAGTYANKTEESLALLNGELASAESTLASATTQDELNVAYRNLVTTVSSKLKNKPKDSKDAPKVDTTNGQPTVGKKAENTEPKSESNAIENTGSHDSRNGKEMVTGVGFRTEGNQAPTVELPYSNADKRQIYIYTGENTDLTFKASDDTTVKDLYLRNKGLDESDNASGYGFTIGKVTNGAVASGDGTVSADKRTATIKMTGVTNLKAPNKWTSFIEAKDNDGVKSMPANESYNVENNYELRRRKLGYVEFIVKSQTDKYDIKTPTEKVAVTDPTNVTEDELAKIKEKLKIEYSNNNDDANLADKKGTEVENQSDRIASITNSGNNIVVTYKDGSTDTISKGKLISGPAPVVTGNPKARNTVLSTDEELSGTGTAGATVKVTIKNPEGTQVISEKTTEVGADGTWKLALDHGLNSNEELRGASTAARTFYAPKNIVEVIQTANGIDSEKTNVTVSIGASTIKPSEASKDGNSVVAGAKEVTVTVPHDAGFTYFFYTNKDNNKETQLDIKREDDGSLVMAGGNASKATIKETVKGNFYDTVTLTLTEPAKEGIVKVIPHNGGATKGTYLGKTSYPVTNEAPVVSPVEENQNEKTVPTETRITKDDLLALVKVTDHEDDQNATLGEKGRPRIVSINGDTNVTTVDTSEAGEYNIVYKVSDSQGKESADYTYKLIVRKNEAPEVTIPYSVDGKKDVYVYANEDFDIPVKFTDDNGTVASATIKRGGNVEQPAKDAANPNVLDNEYESTVEKISTETTATEANPAVVHIKGNYSKATPGLAANKFPTDENGEFPIVTRYATATDTDGKDISNTATGSSYATDPGSFRIVLKAQTAKYDVKELDDANKTVVSNTATLTPEDLATVKENLQLEYSKKNKDKNINKDEAVTPENVKKAVDTVKQDGDNLVVTYKDGSKDTIPVDKVVKLDKQPAIDAVTNKATDQIAAINGNDNLTQAEKDKAIAKVNEDKQAALDKIEDATNKAVIDTAKEEGTVAVAKVNPVAKEAAKQAVTDALKAKNDALDAREDLTQKEKEDAKAAAKVEADKAIVKINEQPDTAPTPAEATTAQTAVDTGKTDGTDAIGKINPIGKQAALDKIDEALKAKEKEIDDRTDLTDEEKKEVKDRAKEIADTKKEEINAKKNNADTEAEAGTIQGEINTVGTDGAAAITALAKEPAKKPEANQAVEGVANNKKAEIEADNTLSPEAKKKLQDEVDEIKKASEEAINGAKKNADVDKAKKAGEQAIKAINSARLPGNKLLAGNPTNLNPEEQEKLKKAIEAVNPGATVTVNPNGSASVILPNGKTVPLEQADLTKSADDLADPNKPGGNNINRPVDKVIVKDPKNLTPEEKAKIKQAVRDVNPNAVVTMDDNGTVTVSTSEGNTAAFPASELVRTLADAAKDDSGNAGVRKPADKLVGDATNADLQAKATEKLKKLNGGDDKVKAINYDTEGNATVVLKDGTIATIPASDLFKTPEEAKKANGGDDINKPNSQTVVANKNALTEPEREAIKAKIAAVNPEGSVITVNEKGEATVTTPEGKTAVIDADDLVKGADEKTNPKAGNNINNPADRVQVADKAELTDPELARIKAAVEAVNPGATVVVDDNGNATVTTPEGKTATIPVADLVKTEADKDDVTGGNQVNTPADRVVVENPAALTEPEKEAVKAKIQAVNPGADVVFDEKGNATVTIPAAQGEQPKTATIPASDLVKPKADLADPAKQDAVNKPADKVVVDPALEAANKDLPTEAKDAIKAAVEAVNPGSTVVVDDKGNATVTTPEGKTVVIPKADLVKTEADKETAKAGNNINKPADKVVADKDALTPENIEAIKAKVQAVNPGATVVVDDKGNATVVTPDGQTATIPVTDLVKSPEEAKDAKAGNNVNKPADKVSANKDALTPEDIKAIEAKVKAVNPDAKVFVDDKGNATVSTPDGKTATIPVEDLVKDPAAKDEVNGGNKVNTPATKVVVTDPANIKADEDKIKAEILKVNPGATVAFDTEGNATVTTKDGAVATIPASDLAKDAADLTKPDKQDAVKKPADKTLVKKAGKLTQAEKDAIKAAVEKVNPSADPTKPTTVVVDDKGNATVTTPDGKTEVIPASDLVKTAKEAEGANAGNNINKPADKVSATPADLTGDKKDEVKAKIQKAVEAVNPGATVFVDDKGNATVTTPDGKTATIPVEDLVKDPGVKETATAGNKVNTPAERTVVANPAELTDAEKAKITAAIQAVNPEGTKVVFDEAGNATVTVPNEDGTTATATIPVSDLVKSNAEKDLLDPAKQNPVKKPIDQTVVADKDALTPTDKEKIAAKVKEVNPGSTVFVDDKGNATVTTTDGKTAVIAADDLVKTDDEVLSDPKAGNVINKPADRVFVKDGQITDDVKAKIAAKVQRINPGATVFVDENGNATVTTPEGKTATIPVADLTKTDADKAKVNAGNKINSPADRVLVKDRDKLTADEIQEIEKNILEVNPGATVVFDAKGNATVKNANGDIATIPVEALAKPKADLLKPEKQDLIKKPVDKVLVTDPANVDKEAIKKAVEEVNPGSTVFVDDNGNATITTEDGRSFVIPAKDLVKTVEEAKNAKAGNNINKPADKVAVTDPTKPLSQEEKKAIEAKIKAVNPDAKAIFVDDKGNATVTVVDKDGNTATATIPAKDLVKNAEEAKQPNAGNKVNTPADKVVVSDPDHLSDEDKAKIADAIKAVNPEAKVAFDDKGNATVTTKDDEVATIPATNLVKTAEEAAKPNAGNNINKPADKTVVADPNSLTDDEKKAIAAKVAAVNPGATVAVDDKGNATVTVNGKTAVIPAAALTKTADSAKEPNAGNDVVKPADKTVVENPESLTKDEQDAIAAKVAEVNPEAKTVVVDDQGNATVTTKDGKTVVIPAKDLVKTAAEAAKPNAGNDVNTPADKTVVANPNALTPEEKKAIEEKVKAVNPGAEVVVDNKGNATVTVNGKTAVIPAADLTKTADSAKEPNAGNDVVKPADKTVVANPESLTKDEKEAIVAKVKAVNPDATVVVDDKGNATVTPKDGKPVVIPASDLTKTAADAAKPNAGNDIVKPADKTVVANPESLTPEEKDAIAAKVKAVNSGAEVVVDDKGNATVTLPNGKTAVIPASDLTKNADAEKAPKAGNDIVKPASKTKVANPDSLTQDEKDAIVAKVKAVNPGSTVVVDDQGNATVTLPNGNTAVIPASDLTKSEKDVNDGKAKDNAVTPASKTKVANPNALTEAEKKTIEDKVKAANPGATVVVDDKGNATVVKDGNVSVIPSTDLVKVEDDATKPNGGNDANTPAAKTVVADPTQLTDEEKAAVKKAVAAVNPGSTVVVDDKGNATVTKGDGTVLNIPALDLVIPAEKFADEAKTAKVKTPAIRTLVGNKENLTKDEKDAVKKSIEAVNPGATVVVDDKGNATVTMPDGSTATISKEQLVKDKEAVSKSKHGGDNLDIDLSKVEVADLANITPEEKAKFQFKVLGAITNVEEFDLDAYIKSTDKDGNTVYTSKDSKVKITIDKDGNATVEKDGKKELAINIDKAGNVTIVTKEGQVLAIPRDDAFKQRPYVPSNGGGNNAANNTAAKVDKAKLEGAIHQLDELFIQESAKLDAETAKEATDLLADAKKVFADPKASQDEVDAMVKRIEDFMAKVAPATDPTSPAKDQAAQTSAVAPATTQAANANQEAATNARKAAKELPNTGTADSTVAMVAAAASALLGLGLAGRRRKEDEEA